MYDRAVATAEGPTAKKTEPRSEADAALDTIEEGALAVERTLGKAGKLLAAPTESDVLKLVESADLPELGPDALSSLLVRLDREADLERSLSLRMLARAAWVGRFAVGAVLLAVIAEMTLAAVCALLAIGGAENAGARGGLVALGMTAILAAAHVGVRHLRASESDLRAMAERVIADARATEARLARIGVTAAFKAADPTEYQIALARLERELSPASKDARPEE
jgi:hypothetical protein